MVRPRRNSGRSNSYPESDDASERDLPLLTAITEALHGSTDIQEALERTLGLVAGLLGLRTGWVWLSDPETGQFYVAASRRLPPYLQEPVRMSGRWCVCTDQFRQGKLIPSNINVMECSRLHPAVVQQDQAQTGGLRFHASIPLYYRDRGLGIMNIAGPSWRALNEDELHLLSIIAAQIGIAVERARLADDTTRLARAEERTRIAREIHDTLAQGLTAIGLDIESALRNLDDNPERVRERLTRALDTTRANLEEARHSVLDLRETPLAGRPLAEALGALGRAFTSQTGVQVHVRTASPECSAGGQPPELPIRLEAQLYRIAQEALANVSRHAQATAVDITLRLTESHLLLTVRDDGVGINGDASNPPESREGHHGIVGMRERARLIGGRLRLTSRAGHGTTVTVRAPLTRQSSPDSQPEYTT